MDWSIRASILWSQGESLSQYIYNDCSPIQEGSLFRVFMAVSLCRCDWLNHLPGAWAQSPAPLSSLEAKGGGWKCQPSIHLVGFPDEQPSPHSETTQGPALSHLISIKSGVVERGTLWQKISFRKLEVFEALCQEARTKTNYIYFVWSYSWEGLDNVCDGERLGEGAKSWWL